MSAPPPTTSPLPDAGLVFAPATPPGALRLGPTGGVDAVRVPGELAPAAESIPLPSSGAVLLHTAHAQPGDDAVVAPAAASQHGATLLGLSGEQPAGAEAILSWVPGAANDTDGQDDPEVDAVVHATLAGLLGEDALADAAVLAPGRDLAEPVAPTPAFTLAHDADESVLEPGALAAAVAMSGASMGDVVLAVDGIDLMLLPADATPEEVGEIVRARADDADIDLILSFDEEPLVYGAGEPTLGDAARDDVIVIEVVGEPGDPGLALL